MVFDWSSLQKGFWWQGKVERRACDRGGMGARSWEVLEAVKVKVKLSDRHGRRTIGVAEAWLGGSMARHRFIN